MILLGAMSDAAGYGKLVSVALKEANLSGVKTAGTLVVIPRKGENASGMIVIEAGNEEGKIELPEKMTDILTGNVYECEMTVAPYSVYVLKSQA